MLYNSPHVPYVLRKDKGGGEVEQDLHIILNFLLCLDLLTYLLVHYPERT